MADKKPVSELIDNIRQNIKRKGVRKLPKPQQIAASIHKLENEIRLLRAIEPVSKEIHGDLDDANLTRRTRKILRKLGVKTLDDIGCLSEQEIRRGSNKEVVEEVKDFLRTRGKKLTD